MTATDLNEAVSRIAQAPCYPGSDELARRALAELGGLVAWGQLMPATYRVLARELERSPHLIGTPGAVPRGDSGICRIGAPAPPAPAGRRRGA